MPNGEQTAEQLLGPRPQTAEELLGPRPQTAEELLGPKPLRPSPIPIVRGLGQFVIDVISATPEMAESVSIQLAKTFPSPSAIVTDPETRRPVMRDGQLILKQEYAEGVDNPKVAQWFERLSKKIGAKLPTDATMDEKVGYAIGRYGPLVTLGLVGLAKKMMGRKVLPTGDYTRQELKSLVNQVISPPERQSSVQKVIAALQEAKPMREIQEQLYTQERAKRFAAAKGVGKVVTGEKGFYAEKAQLRGELPKIALQQLKTKVTQGDIDNLFKTVAESPWLSYTETLNAREGLVKVFTGKVPTRSEMSLLNMVFPSELTNAVLAKRPLMQKLVEGGLQIANIPRSIMASFDLSFGLRQGVFAAPSFRKQFYNSFKKQFRMFGSEKAYQNAMQAVVQDPYYKLARTAKVSFTDVGKIMIRREERFASQWAERIPLIGKGVRASGRAYTGFANKYRLDIFKTLVKNAETEGLKPTRNPELLKQIGAFVNNSTGRGSLGGLENASLALNAFFFSPRLNAARLATFNYLNPVKYVKLDPLMRKQVLKSWLAFLGTGSTILIGAKLGGADVSLDPRSADFAKIKIGNTRIDIWGGHQQFVRMAAQIASGKYISTTTGRILTLGEGYRPITRLDILYRQVESKEAPIFSFITALARGSTYPGERTSIPKEIGNRFVPMVIADMYDLAKDDPVLLPIGALGVFGVGVQTYKQRRVR